MTASATAEAAANPALPPRPQPPAVFDLPAFPHIPDLPEFVRYLCIGVVVQAQLAHRRTDECRPDALLGLAIGMDTASRHLANRRQATAALQAEQFLRGLALQVEARSAALATWRRLDREWRDAIAGRQGAARPDAGQRAA